MLMQLVYHLVIVSPTFVVYSGRVNSKQSSSGRLNQVKIVVDCCNRTSELGYFYRFYRHYICG
jgi:hypothetical protein